ncbi:hypothetical protein V5799_000236 [Amblyomma americanum]|uniref:Chitinase n=1 Tax=Amblyomma americanum TaxID=6943 RepID=A0AAQ4D3M2_AMBAM
MKSVSQKSASGSVNCLTCLTLALLFVFTVGTKDMTIQEVEKVLASYSTFWVFKTTYLPSMYTVCFRYDKVEDESKTNERQKMLEVKNPLFTETYEVYDQTCKFSITGKRTAHVFSSTGVIMASEKPARQLRSAALSPDESGTPSSRLLTPTLLRGEATSTGVKTGVAAAHKPEGPVRPQVNRLRQGQARTGHQSPVRTKPWTEANNTAPDHANEGRYALHPSKKRPAPSPWDRPAKAGGIEGADAKPHVSPKEGPTRSRRIPPWSPGKNLRSPTRTPQKNVDNSSYRLTPEKVLHSRPQSVPLTRQSSGEFGAIRGNRPVAASNTRSPAAQRYTGFPGVQAYVGAPGVIFFSPRRSPGRAAHIAGPLQSQGQSPAVFSPPGPDSDEGEETRNQPGGTVTFLQVWTLCGVTMATLTLPVGLFFLSYMGANGAHFSSFTSDKTLPSTATFSYVGSSSLTPSVSTADPFPGVPRSCLRPVSIRTNFTPSTSRYIRRHLHVRSRKIFCVFNVSRLGRAGRQDLNLVDLPLHYCSGIVYWSVGVANGVVRSRLENLDDVIGVAYLKKILNSQRLFDTQVLLTVGGYPQESAHFSRLGVDPAVMARFVSSLMRMVLGKGLNGAAIHWVHPEPGCGRSDDATTLSSMVSAIRYAYRSVGARGDIAVMLPPDLRISDPIVRLLADRVEWIFLETHLLQPLMRSTGACLELANRVIAMVNGLHAGPNGHKICTGYSLAPWLALGAHRAGVDPYIYRFSNITSPDTGRSGTASMLDICSGSRTCVATLSGSCLVLGRALLPGSLSSPAPLYIFHDHETLFNIFSHGSPQLAVNSTNRCAVLYDLESDNFKTMCTVLNVSYYAHLKHFADITERPGGASDLQLAPPCL